MSKEESSVINAPEAPEATAQMSLIERMKAAAAAQYAKPVSVAATSLEQQLKDIIKAKIATLTLANSVNVVTQTAVPDGLNVDLDKTAVSHLKETKEAFTKICKTFSDWLTANPTLTEADFSQITNFAQNSVPVQWQTVELAPLFKGAIVLVDLANVSAEAAQKLAAVGITADTTGGVAILTGISLDKTVNTIFVKVAGMDVKAGTVRLSARFVSLLDGANAPETVESFNAKMEELRAQFAPVVPKFSKKSLEYVRDLIVKNATDENFAFPENFVCNTPVDVANYIQYLLEIK